MEAGPPQGWYEDPRNRARLRWWDGSAWTDHTQERPAEANAGGARSDADAAEADRRAQQLLAMEVASTPSAADADPMRRLLPWLIGGIVLLLALGATAIIVGGSSDEELPAQTTPPLDPDGEAADGQVQEQARTAQTAIETYATDNGGSYEGATPEALVKIEPTLAGASLTVEPAADSYTLSIESGSGNTFTITRDSAGSLTFTCADPARAGCPASGFWG